MYKNLFYIILMLILTSCTLFQIRRPDIEQGNVITPEMISRLKIGMTEREVRSIMGNAVLVNIFSPNRLDYIYTFESGQGLRTQKRVSLIFINNRLREIQPLWR